MSTPEHRETLAATMARLTEWAHWIDKEMAARAVRMRDYDEWLGEHETRFQEYELRAREYEQRARERQARIRKLEEESQENQTMMREVLSALTMLQADLARIEGAE